MFRTKSTFFISVHKRGNSSVFWIHSRLQKAELMRVATDEDVFFIIIIVEKGVYRKFWRSGINAHILTETVCRCISWWSWIHSAILPPHEEGFPPTMRFGPKSVRISCNMIDPRTYSRWVRSGFSPESLGTEPPHSARRCNLMSARAVDRSPLLGICWRYLQRERSYIASKRQTQPA